ncbi:MAG: hypothetical protein JJU33_09715 [Phycisphaerales bacterium]|nr:hypothetical protein [Phycisphaerales bacterium]
MGRALLVKRITEDPVEAVELDNINDFDALKARLERDDLPLVEPVNSLLAGSLHRTQIPNWAFDETNRSWETQSQDQRGLFVAIGIIWIGIAAAVLYYATLSGRFDPFGAFAIMGYISLLAGAAFIGIALSPKVKTCVLIGKDSRIVLSRIVGRIRTDSLPIPSNKADLLLARAAFPGTIKGTIDYRYILVLLAETAPVTVLATHWSLARVLRVKDEMPEPLRSSKLYALKDFNLKVRCKSQRQHCRTGPTARGAARISGLSVPNKAARHR